MSVNVAFLLVHVNDGVSIDVRETEVKCTFLIGASKYVYTIICIGEVYMGTDLSSSTYLCV